MPARGLGAAGLAPGPSRSRWSIARFSWIRWSTRGSS